MFRFTSSKKPKERTVVNNIRRGRSGSTRTYAIRKKLTGESKFRVRRWLNKVLTVDSAVTVSSPNGGGSLLTPS
eukprot:681103-Prorocentrum_minimum.AAC.1